MHNSLILIDEEIPLWLKYKSLYLKHKCSWSIAAFGNTIYGIKSQDTVEALGWEVPIGEHQGDFWQVGCIFFLL